MEIIKIFNNYINYVIELDKDNDPTSLLILANIFKTFTKWTGVMNKTDSKNDIIQFCNMLKSPELVWMEEDKQSNSMVKEMMGMKVEDIEEEIEEEEIEMEEEEMEEIDEEEIDEEEMEEMDEEEEEEMEEEEEVEDNLPYQVNRIHYTNFDKVSDNTDMIDYSHLVYNTSMNDNTNKVASTIHYNDYEKIDNFINNETDTTNVLLYKKSKSYIDMINEYIVNSINIYWPDSTSK